MSGPTSKVCVFYCCSKLEPDQLSIVGDGLNEVTVKAIGLPCSGKIDVPYLVKAFETGADGAVIVACEQSECRHLEGNLRAVKRAEAVDSLLEEIGMGKGRMAVVMLGKDGVEQVIAEIRCFIDRIKNLPAPKIQGNAAKFQENIKV